MHAYAISFKFQLPSENEDKRKVNFSETFFQFSEAGKIQAGARSRAYNNFYK